MISDYISSAIKAVNADRKRPVHEKQSVSPGEIRRVGSGSVERLALILMVNSETNTSQITLVHNYSEFATEQDIIVESAITDLSYVVVIQTDLRGVVSTAEVGELIAMVPEKLVAACFQGIAGFVEDLSMFIGPPILGPLDARWDFKVEEGETIRELCSATVEVLTGDSASQQVELGLPSQMYLWSTLDTCSID